MHPIDRNFLLAFGAMVALMALALWTCSCGHGESRKRRVEAVYPDCRYDKVHKQLICPVPDEIKAHSILK